MIEYNFKTQPATTIEQSQRLLDKGLRKETADCYYFYCDIAKEWKCTVLSSTQVFKDYPTTVIPAWSLHRLLSLIEYDDGFIDVSLRGARYGIHYGYDDGWYDNLYDAVISCIEALIEEKDFNREYLV